MVFSLSKKENICCTENTSEIEGIQITSLKSGVGVYMGDVALQSTWA